MNLSEVLLIVIIALCVFPKKKWPMLAYHLAHLYRAFEKYKFWFIRYWKSQIHLYQLELNQKKAKKSAPPKD